MRLRYLFRRLRNIETGGEGTSGGGASDAGMAGDTGGATSDAGTSDHGQVAGEAGPKTMLEAISDGLKVGDGAAGDRVRDELGRFASKEGQQSVDNKPETVDGQPAKPADAAKPAEQTGDEFAVPEGLTPKAKERFESLVTKIKDTSAALETMQADMNQFREIVSQSQASPEEFVQALDYIRMVNTGDLRGALQVLDAQRQMLALAIGQPLPGADPLAAFPDLRQRVDAYQMDEQAAIEIARARQAQSVQLRQQSAQQQAYQQEESARAEKQSAVAEIDKLSAQWARTDPDFAHKEDIILKQLPEIARAFPPSMWARQVQILYQTISAMPAAQAVRHNPPPLRASGQTAGARQPTSMLEALQSGLGYNNG